MLCTACGNTIQIGASSCIGCGAAICVHCGRVVRRDSSFCAACGQKLDAALYSLQQSAATETRTVLAVGTATDKKTGFEYAETRTDMSLNPTARPPDGGALGPGFILSTRYRIERELGRGGMGVVYLAHDLSLDHDVAVKVLPSELAHDERALRDLKREAKAAMMLSHPNIMRLHNFEETKDFAFLIMEYVQGETIANLLSRMDRLPLDQACNIAIQVCRGLHYAHSQNVIHRDIKPANVMLHKSSVVKIADFGIARIVHDTMTRMTRAATSGTLAYMAPEVLQGENSGVRSDIYSFGILFYEMLSGRPPFTSGDITYQHINVRPKPIAGISDNVNRIILGCLEKSPSSRWSSAGEIADILEHKREPQIATAKAVQTGNGDLENGAQRQRRELESTVKNLRGEGTAYLEQGKYQLAISRFEEALKLAPSERDLLQIIELACHRQTADAERLRREKEAARKAQDTPSAAQAAPKHVEFHPVLSDHSGPTGRRFIVAMVVVGFMALIVWGLLSYKRAIEIPSQSSTTSNSVNKEIMGQSNPTSNSVTNVISSPPEANTDTSINVLEWEQPRTVVGEYHVIYGEILPGFADSKIIIVSDGIEISSPRRSGRWQFWKITDVLTRRSVGGWHLQISFDQAKSGAPPITITQKKDSIQSIFRDLSDAIAKWSQSDQGRRQLTLLAVPGPRLDGAAISGNGDQIVISNVATANIISTSASISWTTNVASDSQVRYGLTNDYGSLTALNSDFVTSHTQRLEALSPDTVYHYRVTAKDSGGNLGSSGDLTFRTTPLKPAPSEIVCQAEEAQLAGTAKASSEHRGYSGSGYVDGYGYKGLGATTSFVVNAPAEGDYTVSLRYANASGAERTLSIYVNGSRMRGTRLPALDNWDVWSEVRETLHLHRGQNTIAYKYDPGDSGNVNLDLIRVNLTGLEDVGDVQPGNRTEPRLPEMDSRQPIVVDLPRGTPIKVRLLEQLSTDKNHDGDIFLLELCEDLARDGINIAPRASRAHGKVVTSRPQPKTGESVAARALVQ